MESFGDKARAFIYALLVHLACICMMFIGLLWTKAAAPVSVPGPVIEAELIGPSAAPKPAPAKPKPAPPKPVEKPPEKQVEKPPEPPPPPAEPPRTDAIEREKVAEIAMQKAEQAQKAEEEKRKREQTLLEDQQRERLKQIEEIKRQREAAEKKRKLEQEKLAQLKDLSKQKPAKPQAQAAQVPEAEQAKSGTEGSDTGLLAEYSTAIINVVKLNWNRPDNAQPGLRCTLKVIQLPGGDVMSVQAMAPCNADQVTRASIEEAVTKAQPLPYKGYEKVFTRELTLIFKYDGN